MIDGLRWVAITPSDHVDEVVCGVVRGYPENGPIYYKLQWLDLSGFWRDVAVETGK